MKKRWLSLLLGCVLLCSMGTVYAEEETKTEEAVKPAYLTRAVTEATVEITAYQGTDANVVVPSVIDGKTVVGIAEGAFKEKEQITSVTLPANISTVPEYAFAECPALKNVVLQAAQVTVGAYAFYNCAALTTVQTTGNIDSVGNGAFYNCVSLVDVQAKGGIRRIGKYGFRGCQSLVDLDIRKTSKIGAYAFFSCSQLTSVTAGKMLNSIGKNAFLDTSEKLVLTVSKKSKLLTYAKRNQLTYRYDDNTLLEDEEVIYKKGKYRILRSDKKKGTCIFLNPCDKELSTFTIPNAIKVNGVSYKVVKIADYAFFSLKNLRQVTVGKQVRQVGSGAFAYCNRLSKVTFHNKKVVILSDSFEYSKKAKIIKK